MELLGAVGKQVVIRSHAAVGITGVVGDKVHKRDADWKMLGTLSYFIIIVNSPTHVIKY